MRDVDEQLRALRPAVPMPLAPAWPRPARWRWGMPLLALAAVVLLAVGWRIGWPTDGPSTRGQAETPLAIDLRLAIERGGVAVRPAGHAAVGERVFFRVTASTPAAVVVWVEGPAGQEPIGTVVAGDSPVDLGGPGGLVAYAFDAPGRYRFFPRVGVGECADCPSVLVEVR